MEWVVVWAAVVVARRLNTCIGVPALAGAPQFPAPEPVLPSTEKRLVTILRK